MAAPVYESVATQAGASDTTSITVNKPSGLADNDVLIACIAKNGSGTMAAPGGAGWTEHVDAAGAEGSTIAVYSKVVTNAAGEPTSWTFTASSAGKFATACLRISGADTTTPVVVVGSTATGATTSAIATSVTPGVVDCLLFQATSVETATAGMTHSVMTQRVSLSSGGSGPDGSKTALGVATETLSASTATGTRTMTVLEDWITVLFAVQPAASATGTALPILPRLRRSFNALLAQ